MMEKKNAVSVVRHLCHCSEWSPSAARKLKGCRKVKGSSQDWAEAILEVVTSNWELQPLTQPKPPTAVSKLAFHTYQQLTNILAALARVVVQINSVCLQALRQREGDEGIFGWFSSHSQRSACPDYCGLFFWEVADIKKILIKCWKNGLEKSH